MSDDAKHENKTIHLNVRTEGAAPIGSLYVVADATGGVGNRNVSLGSGDVLTQLTQTLTLGSRSNERNTEPKRKDMCDSDLHLACRDGRLYTVKSILDKDLEDVNRRGRLGKTPVMLAAEKGHTGVYNLLISKGANETLVDDNLNNLLHIACTGGHLGIVKSVLSESRFQINRRGQLGRTPLMFAAEAGHRKVFDLLVSEGGDVSVVDDDGNNVLHVACIGGDAEMVKFVLSKNLVDINAKNRYWSTAAVISKENGNLAICELLVSKGCKADKDIARLCRELVDHFLTCKDKRGLRTLLTEKAVFEYMYEDEQKHRLFKIWQELDGYEEAAKAYTNFLEKYVTAHRIEDTNEGYKLKTLVGWFLVDIGQYDQALDLFLTVIEGVKKKYGDEAKEVADPLHGVVAGLYWKGLTFSYGSDPGHEECRQDGRKYGAECEKIHRLHWSPDDNHLGQVLILCGFFNTNLLQDCKIIFEKNENTQGLAETLFLQGAFEQSNANISVPEATFMKSLALCHASYGRFHIQTARCNQLYGQMYWNQWVTRRDRQDWLDKSLSLYKEELVILEEVQGKQHPNTLRSRRDVAIVVQTINKRTSE